MIVARHSIDETHILAEKLAAHISPGSVVALIGDLGTGKTTFTQGFAKALGISERVQYAENGQHMITVAECKTYTYIRFFAGCCTAPIRVL